jgi:hydrogenase nickel incorporation protein HypB
VELETDVLAKNASAAAHNRGWFEGRGVLALNMMSSPGSGKTTLLEKTLRTLLAQTKDVFVLEGDQETTRDADRIRATGARALQINTGKGCHLEADMVMRGASSLEPPQGSLLFIENVGNLVCPALFDLGEAARVVLFSVTEGEDKPLKYPHMFRAADLVLLTKVDLLPHLDFDMAAARESILTVKPKTPILEVSSRSGVGMAEWLQWIASRRGAPRA